MDSRDVRPRRQSLPREVGAMTSAARLLRMSEQDYPPIGEHGLIGDLQTSALVTVDGTIDWLCLPRFDSPSVFSALLDTERGGHWRMAPTCEVSKTHQFYFPDSAVLVTRFLSE